LVQVGNAHKLHRNVAYDSADEQRWCKTWVIAEAHNTAVRARLVAKRKNGASGACAWTDFSLIEITGTYGFSDSPSDSAYDLPMKSFETPRAPREASGVANRLLVYGVYKDPTNTAELESVVYDAGLTLTKAQGGSLDANTYWVRVVAETPDGDVYVKYATETITDADVAAATPVRTLSANWSSVPTATQYRVYIGSGRMQMRLKATQAGTSLSITTMPAGGAALSGEPDVYYYKTFDFAPGLWESGGKVVEATLNDQLVDSEEKAQTRALSFWEEKGIAMRTWEFDHLEEPPMVGSVIPFIWGADDIAEPLVVKGNKGKFLGDKIFWTTTVGSDPSLIKKGVTQIFADLKQATLRLNDTQAPVRPLNLALTAPSGSLIQTVDGVSRATVVAEWEPSTEDDFAHYVVQYGYDSNFSNAQVINVAQTPNIRSAATGINAKVVHSFQAEPGKRLYFRAAAQDKTGNRSDFTDSAIDLPADTTPPDAPTNVQITASLKSIAITWGFGFYDPALPDQNTINTDFSRFRVYRKQYNAATNPNEPWVKIAETSTNVYIDTNFANYTSLFQYKVSTVDRTGNESTATQEATPTFRSPNKITGSVDIEDATITSAQIASLTANLITAGTLNISTGMSVISDGTAALPQFEVDKDGVTIRDDSGNIVLQVNGATSTLNADYIDVTNLAASEVTVGSGNSVVRVGNYPSSVSPTFQGIWGGNANPSSAAFTLSTSGAVTASNISATGGTVGGWLIGSTSLSGGDTTIASSGDITVGSGSNIARISSSDPAYRLWLGATTASTAPFRVTSTGSFTATDANITGTVSTNNITATGGTVGGWALSSTSLTAGTGGNTVGIATSGGYAFYAGDSDPSLAEFSVTPAGALTATNATVSGSITATSGSIGGWTIGAATISSSSGNVVLNNNGVITAGAASPNQAHMSGNGFWAGAGAADYATAPFRVSTSGGVTAKNISVIGGTVSVGDAPVAISYLSRNASGVVTIKTSSAVNATVGQNITIDVTSSPYTTDADFNGSFNVLSITTSSPYTLTYQGATASAIAEVAATGFVYTGARISGESASGTWFSIDSGFALKNPANVSQNIITATASDVTINADFIKAGTVTLGNLGSNAISSTNFSVSNTGTVTAAAGTIGGWTLSSTALTSGTGASTVGLATSGGYAIYAGDSTAGSAPFSVTPAGVLKAESGTVGGWALSSTALTSGTGANAVGVATSGGYAFYAGDTDPSLAEFRVTPAGVLTATNATITGAITATSGSFTGDVTTNNISATAGTVGGWTLTSSGSTRLYAGTTNAFTGLVASSTSSAVAIFAGATSDSGTSASFTVTNAGALSASNATISGSITATAGSIGGWSVDGSRIYNALAISPYIAGLQGSSTSTGIAFFAGATSSTGATSAFSVNNSGAVTASNITATGGTIGGWTLASTPSRLHAGSGSAFVGLSADTTSLATTIFAGATDSTGTGAKFKVLNDGSITATSGTIGGWDLASDRITGVGTTKYAGLINTSTDAGLAFFAGASDTSGTSASFTVTNEGALTATGATISGAITATSGSFTGLINANSGSIGGWSIGSDKIYNSGVAKFIGLVDAAADTGVALFAGATNSTGTGATFTVTNAGVLTATGANITGDVTTSNINATGGTVGGWSISSDRIWSGSGSAYVGMSTGSTAFFAGANTSSGGSAVFSVGNNGTLTASSANITGTVSADSLTIRAVQFVITNASKTSTTAVITTSANHSFIVGDTITVALTSGPTNYGELVGTWTVTSVTTNTITFTTTGTSTVTSGSAVGYVSYGSGNDAIGKIAIVPASSQGGASLTVQTDTSGSLYTSADILSATSGSSSSDSTVTTENAHGFIAGQFVSFHSTGNATWNNITASYPVQIKATPTATTFTFRPFISLTALASNNAGTVRAYKRLSVIAPGGTFFYQSGTTPGVIATGSLALGSNLSSLGIGTLGTLADGEIGFLSPTTPRYTGGANLYSNDGGASLDTSGTFWVHGASLEVGVNGTTRGSIYARGDGTNGGRIALYAGSGSTGGTIAWDVANGRFSMNNDLAISGALTGVTSLTMAGALSGVTTLSASSSITTTAGVTVDDTSGVYWNVASGTDGNIYYSAGNYFLVNDDVRINMATTASTSDVYINSASGYGTLARFSSARRYKMDIQDFNVPLSDVVQLRPVTFKWNPETTKSEETGEITGLIAEEVESISDAMKRICRYNEETGEIESVQYSQLAVFLVGAIKELAQKNNALEARVAELEGA
jgi:hypothetical protein